MDAKFCVCWNDERQYFETIEDAIEFIARQTAELQLIMKIMECY